MDDIYVRFHCFTWREKRSHNFFIGRRYNHYNYHNNPYWETPAYEYAENKIKTDDIVTLSANSDIGKPTVKKYTTAEDEIILDIAVNNPVTMNGGKKLLYLEGRKWIFFFGKNISLNCNWSSNHAFLKFNFVFFSTLIYIRPIIQIKISWGLSNITVNDRIDLTSTGAIKSDDGEYIAMHPVASSDD